MKRTKFGKVNKTYLLKDKVIQELNPKFRVPSKETTNKLIDLLRANGIICAKVLKQNKQIRELEILEGNFYDRFTFKQAKQAIIFLKKIHKIIKSNWGDVNASNFLWQRGKIVGIVDYDTIGWNNLDVGMAIVNWQKSFSYKYAKMIANAYGLKDWITQVQNYILFSHKQWSNAYLGLDHIKKPKSYCIKRIKKLNYQYEKSIDWRSF